jgi:glycosyltransferase involved in cell wall biosynthesis
MNDLRRAEAPRVLIVAEHASAVFGGEAILPTHYFRHLRRRGVEAWLLVHERTREELLALLPDEKDRIFFVRDTLLHKVLGRMANGSSGRLASFVVGFPLQMFTQLQQRLRLRDLLSSLRPTVVHQPIPVSPTFPSAMFGLGVPVIIGPMNGGMDYPKGFAYLRGVGDGWPLKLARWLGHLVNRLIPGKLRAATLLVANERTRRALPKGVSGRVLEMVENGVDLEAWRPPDVSVQPTLAGEGDPILFVFVGRMIELKCVDVLLDAFQEVARRIQARLLLIGDGPERPALEARAEALKLRELVTFTGWLRQAECARRVQAAQVLILPSVHECGGAVVLEAMALGLPVIAAAWGGPADYVDASTGILVPPTSRKDLLEGLKDAMLRLAGDRALRRRLGESGRLKVQASFNWSTKISEMLEIYERTAAGN